ncbi:hypothetical protein JG688_00002251 [Phytophthora aleatoria]|uniref:Uncharacterized protein n=1 Tax=Phytophthora aleatoria TaxID=2496075 RepID=A0A8J5J5V3_9STRA|nr:hypothetical protein JG688_00002251 [Phytophthora aleatoria]
MSIDAHNSLHYALLGLSKHTDVLKWFRDEGEYQFPSIALLARIHLGKISSSASKRGSGKAAAAAAQQRRSREVEAGRAQGDRLIKKNSSQNSILL